MQRAVDEPHDDRARRVAIGEQQRDLPADVLFGDAKRGDGSKRMTRRVGRVVDQRLALRIDPAQRAEDDLAG